MNTKKSAIYINNIVYYVIWIIEALLSLRFVFKLFAANAANSFVDLLYSVTDTLIRPFIGIFRVPPTVTDGVFEIATLIAMIIYGLLGYAITYFVHLMLAPKNNNTTIEPK